MTKQLAGKWMRRIIAAPKRAVRRVTLRYSLKVTSAHAMAASKAGDWVEAAQRWEEIIEKYGRDAPIGASIQLSIALRMQGKFAEADAAIERAQRKRPDYIGLAIEYARIATASENWFQAAKRWRSVINNFGGNAPATAYKQLGMSLTDVRDIRSVATQRSWLICNSSRPSAYQSHPEIAAASNVADSLVRAFPPAPFVAHVTDVAVVGGTRYLLTQDNVLIHDEAYTFLNDESVSLKLVKRLSGQRPRINMLPNTESIIDCAIHGMHEYASNYFHLVAEVLPRILIAREQGVTLEIPLLVNAGLHPNLRELIEIIEPGRRKVQLGNGRLCFANRLIFPSDVSSIQDVYTRPRRSWECVLHNEIIRHCVDIVLSAKQVPKAPRTHTRLYVRRGTRHRALENEPEIETMLAEMNFEAITPDDLTLEDQLTIFRNAEIIVAPTGAALTNIVWCRPGTSVIVLASDHEAAPIEVWTQLAEVSGCRTFSVLGSQGPVRHRWPMHCDFTVAPSALAAALKAI